MQFTEVDVKSVNVNRKENTKIGQFIDDFVQANVCVAEVHWENNYKSIESARNSLKRHISDNKMNHINIMVRGNKIYIFNKLLNN